MNHQEAGGRNILHYAAGSGNREMFLDVLETVDEHQVELGVLGSIVLGANNHEVSAVVSVSFRSEMSRCIV